MHHSGFCSTSKFLRHVPDWTNDNYFVYCDKGERKNYLSVQFVTALVINNNNNLGNNNDENQWKTDNHKTEKIREILA